jgi:hypothetical protein
VKDQAVPHAYAHDCACDDCDDERELLRSESYDAPPTHGGDERGVE